MQVIKTELNGSHDEGMFERLNRCTRWPWVSPIWVPVCRHTQAAVLQQFSARAHSKVHRGTHDQKRTDCCPGHKR
jgi:hypothetical protein